jgi:hypothetical protein
MTLYTPVQASVIVSRAIDYPTPEQIAQQHAELLQMLRDLGRRTICYPFWGSLLSLWYQRVSAMYQES